MKYFIKYMKMLMKKNWNLESQNLNKSNYFVNFITISLFFRMIFIII